MTAGRESVACRGVSKCQGAAEMTGRENVACRGVSKCQGGIYIMTELVKVAFLGIAGVLLA